MQYHIRCVYIVPLFRYKDKRLYRIYRGLLGQYSDFYFFRMLYQIEISRVESPNNFWIAKKDSLKFLEFIDQTIRTEENEYDYYYNQIDDTDVANSIFAVFDESKKKWLRAKFVSKARSFKSDTYLVHLIDIGETTNFEMRHIRKLRNKKISEIPPLVTECSLAGLVPIESNK